MARCRKRHFGTSDATTRAVGRFTVIEQDQSHAFAVVVPVGGMIDLGSIIQRMEPDHTDVLIIGGGLVGTSVAEFSRQDFTGRYLDELAYSARDSVEWQTCYRHIHGRRRPVIGDNRLSFTDGRVAIYEFAILPLRRGDDPAGSFIAAEAYEGFDRLDIAQLTPVTRGAA